ncbi:MAG TPA: hypothetical protein VHF01_16670 [Candidatus Acidoferrum sp.]|nr:hypothetical protein [Candidatus Acidoferrum sp.]
MAVIIALLAAAPGSIPKWSVVILVLLGGLFFSVGVVGHEWVKRPHTIRDAAVMVGVFTLIWGAMIASGRAIWPRDQWRHLNQEQKDGLAKLVSGLPNGCGLLVYVPIGSTEAQSYGKEIQDALHAHGLKANLILAGAVGPPVGIVVGVQSVTTPCGFAGEMLSVAMTHNLQMPARLQENYFYAAETVEVIFVGIKPTYD